MTQNLITRLSKLDAPDREVDAMLYCFQHGHTYSRKYGNDYAMWVVGVPHEVRIADLYLDTFTASIDAAIALAERVLPGWTIARLGQDDNKRWNAELRHGHLTAYDRVTLGGAPNGEIALCIALLRAKEAST